MTPRWLHAGLPVLALLAVVGLWGPSFVATKLALREVPPLTLACLRFSVAALCLYPLWWRSKERGTLTRSNHRRLLLGGLLGVTLYFLLENLGIQRTTASNAALLVAAIPALSFLAEALWFRPAVSWQRGLGIGLSIAGVFLVVGQTPAVQGGKLMWGNLLVIGAALCWAAYSLLGRASTQIPKLTVVAHQTVYGAAMLLPLALLETSQWQALSWASGVSVVYLGVLCSAVAYLLYNFALNTLQASQASAFLNLIPIIGVITAVVFLGEPIQVWQYLGGGVIITGVVISTRA